MINPQDPCALCGNVPYGTHIVAIPKAIACVECWHALTADQQQNVGDSIPCCHSRIFIESLRGCLIERDEDVPENQTWFSIPAEKRLLRFRNEHGAAFDVIPEKKADEGAA